MALAVTFAGVVELLGLASRGVPYGTTAGAAAGARVPPWLAALGQVLYQ
ncbi:hypothetical protein [Roseiflexus sp.]|nr:hypothetical protein [Roseiflexus sp.]